MIAQIQTNAGIQTEHCALHARAKCLIQEMFPVGVMLPAPFDPLKCIESNHGIGNRKGMLTVFASFLEIESYDCRCWQVIEPAIKLNTQGKYGWRVRAFFYLSQYARAHANISRLGYLIRSNSGTVELTAPKLEGKVNSPVVLFKCNKFLCMITTYGTSPRNALRMSERR